MLRNGVHNVSEYCDKIWMHRIERTTEICNSNNCAILENAWWFEKLECLPGDNAVDTTR